MAQITRRENVLLSENKTFSAHKTKHEFNTYLMDERGFVAAQATRREQNNGHNPDSGHVIGGPTRLDNHPDENVASGGLSGDLLERFSVEELLESGSESEVMLVLDKQTREHFVLKLYRQNITPNTAVVERLEHADTTHIVKIYEHGFENNRYYELLAYSKYGTLRRLLNQDEPHDCDSNLQILKEITDSIGYIHMPDIDVIHRDIKPENILIYTWDPLNLVLIDFGISSFISQTNPHTTKAFTLQYAAPECLDGTVLKESDYWSLGMLVMEMINGVHPFAGLEGQYIEESLRKGGWPPQNIEFPDSHWRRLCLGLLNRKPKERWGPKQINQWLESQVKQSTSNHTDNSSVLPNQYFLIGGIECNSARSLAKELARHWQEGVDRFEHGDIRTWVENELKDAELAALAYALAEKDIDPNLRLLRFIYGIDPKLPPIWKQAFMDRASVFTLCQKAEAGDLEAQSMVEEIYDLGVLDELGKYRNDSTLIQLQNYWKSTVEDYESGWGDIKVYNAPVGAMPVRSVYLAEIYRNIVFDESEHRRINDAIAQEYIIQIAPCSWLLALGYPVSDLSLARKLVLLSLVTVLEERANQQLRTYYDAEEDPWVSVNGQELHHKGEDYPAISFSSMSTGIYFFYGDSPVLIGQKVRLSWNAGEATTVNISGVGFVDAEGEKVVDIYSSTVFTLYAKGTGWKVSNRLPPITVHRIELADFIELHSGPPNVKQPTPLQPVRLKLKKENSLRSMPQELRQHAKLIIRQTSLTNSGKLDTRQPLLSASVDLSNKSFRLRQLNIPKKQRGWKQSLINCFSKKHLNNREG